MIKDVLITPLDIIDTPDGNVMHAMRESDAGYIDFGEAYFSKIKSWNRKRNLNFWKSRHVKKQSSLLVDFSKNQYFFGDLSLLGVDFVRKYSRGKCQLRD